MPTRTGTVPQADETRLTEAARTSGWPIPVSAEHRGIWCVAAEKHSLTIWPARSRDRTIYLQIITFYRADRFARFRALRAILADMRDIALLRAIARMLVAR